MTAKGLDELEALLAAATPGPWGDDYGRSVIAGFLGGGTVVVGVTTDPDDADLIVAAVNALPDLIAEVRALRAADTTTGRVEG